MRFTFGQYLRNARLNIGMQQQAFAKATNYSKTLICDIEKDRRQPSDLFLTKAAEILKVDIEYLYYVAGRFYKDANPLTYSAEEFAARMLAFRTAQVSNSLSDKLTTWQQHKHYWQPCHLCGSTTICGVCGNNSCNGGHGTLPNGTDCLACDSAYQMMRLDLAEQLDFREPAPCV